MKRLALVIAVLAGCAADDATTDGSKERQVEKTAQPTEATAPVCPQYIDHCGSAPATYTITPTVNADGSITITAADWDKVRAFEDRTMVWSACKQLSEQNFNETGNP